MKTEPNGLASVPEIEALADQLSKCADELHKRIVKDIGAHHDGPVSEADQAVARALLDDELVLRQRANSLYADGASLIVKSLGRPQQHVNELTAAAAEKIRQIGSIRNVVGLVAGLLALAGAAASGQPAPIVLALEKIKHQVEKINASSVKKKG